MSVSNLLRRSMNRFAKWFAMNLDFSYEIICLYGATTANEGTNTKCLKLMRSFDREERSIARCRVASSNGKYMLPRRNDTT